VGDPLQVKTWLARGNKCFLCGYEVAYRTPPGSFAPQKRSGSKCFICAKAKRHRQMFYLCESEASATNVLSVRKRSVSNKAPNRIENLSHVLIWS